MIDYVNTPFNYTGSKFKQLSLIVPKFDKTKSNFIDLFCGGGSVYTNILESYDKVYANDIIGDLINAHKMLHNGDDIITDLKTLCVEKDDPDGYSQLRDNYNLEPTPAKLWALMLNCTSNMMRFNKKFKFNQTFGKRGYNTSIDSKIISYVEHIRKYNNIEYLNLPFNSVEVVNDSFVYIDPPYGYIDNDGKIGNKQISEAGYNCYWNKSDDINLLEYILLIDGGGDTFMVSSLHSHNENKSWLVERLLEYGFNYEYVQYDYNKVSRVGKKTSQEIIITNY
jgi:DNA adenine methylase